MPQPNSGRMGRSPCAVARISTIASRTSSSSETSLRPPRASTRSGKPMPVPMMSVPSPRSPEHDLGAGDLHDAAAAVDGDAHALQRQLAGGLDAAGAARLDGDVALG